MSPDDIQITEIQFTPVRPTNGHVGFVSFIYNGLLKIDSVAVYTRLNPAPTQNLYRLVYPQLKGYNVVYPINKETGDCVEKEVSSYIENLMR